MSMPIPLRADFEASRLRRLARESKDASQARRLLALATIYAGGTRTQAAELGGVGLQIVRDWVVRFNAEGPGGLIDKKAPGQPPLLKAGIGAPWRRSSKTARSRRSMAWCAGGWWIWSSGCGRSSASRSPRRP